MTLLHNGNERQLRADLIEAAEKYFMRLGRKPYEVYSAARDALLAQSSQSSCPHFITPQGQAKCITCNQRTK